MSNEISYEHTETGVTLYCAIVNTARQWWNTSGTPAFETLTVANWSNYGIALSEAPASSYFYVGTFPAVSGNMVIGHYWVKIYKKAGGAYARSDVQVASYFGYWNGTTFIFWPYSPELLASTTIATLASQTSFTLTVASPQNNSYIGQSVVITSANDSTKKAVGIISAYTGSTKTVTLASDPAIYTMAVGDYVSVVAGGSGSVSGTVNANVVQWAGSSAGIAVGSDNLPLVHVGPNALGISALTNDLLQLLTRGVTFTGTTTTIVTADMYLPNQFYNGSIAYKSTTLGTPVYLWSNGTNYIASTVLGTNGAAYFQSSTSHVNGTWTAQGTAGGTTTVTAHGHSQLAAFQFDQANTNAFRGTIASATSTTVTLSSDIGPDNIVQNNLFNIVDGTGSGQSMPIASWVRSTKLITISGAQGWAVVPDSTSVYEIPYSDTPGTDSAGAVKVQFGAQQGQLTTSGGRTNANVTKVNGTDQTAGDLYGYLTANLGTAGAALTAVPALVWAVASSTLTGAGTIGKRIVDYLTGDIFTRLGAPAGASTSADIAAINAKTTNLPANPASTTNITGGTITTVTNLTNAPTAGDLTAAMKASVTAAVPSASAIATAVGLPAHFTNSTFASDGVFSTAALANAPGGSGGGSGSISVTITVNDGTNPIQNATVNLLVNASHYFATTNSSGVATLTPTEGSATYSVRIAAIGYQFTPATLVVSGATSHTYSMTAISITPSSPGYVTAWLVAYDKDGNAVSGVTHTLTITQVPSGTGVSLSQRSRSVQSAATTGLVEFTQVPIGAKITVMRTGGNQETVLVADAGGGLMPLPNLLA